MDCHQKHGRLAEQPISGKYRAVVYCLFFLSGATGLVYEVAWGKYMALFFGSTATAHTIVLATFMAGLALGYVLLGSVADRTARRLALYGLLETGIGLLCLVFPLTATALSRVYVALASGDVGSPRNIALKIILSAVTLLPPAILMGGTLPALSRYFVHRLRDTGYNIGLLYFINSAGAATGCLVAGFWLIRVFGLDLSMVLTALVNIGVGAASMWLGRFPEPEHTRTLMETPEAGQPSAPQAAVLWKQRVIIALIFVSGCVSMLYELVWIRLLALVFGSSTYSFSLMLFTFITGIALGALLATALLRRQVNPWWFFAGAELGIFVSLLLMIPLYERVPYWFNILAATLTRRPDTFGLYIATKAAVTFGLMAIPTTLIGMTLPLASSVVTTKLDVLGRSVGTAFSANTLGNVVGSTLTGFLLLPALGLQSTMELGILASGLIGVAACAAASVSRHRIATTLVSAALVVGGWTGLRTLSPRWSQAVLNAGIYRVRSAIAHSYAELKTAMQQRTILFHRDDPDVSVAVGHTPKGPEHLWLNLNGKTDASTESDMGSQLLVAHIPLLLTPQARDVLIVGLGSGVTAGAALRHPISRCEVVEISQAVVEGSRYFDRVSGAPLEDPRTKLVVADAKEYLELQGDRTYDVIISEPSNPWIAGIGNLFSIEFFRQTMHHLKPEGCLVQWLHLYEMDDTTLAVALNTLSSVYPYVTVWHTQGNDIVMVASRKPQSADPDVLDSLLHARGLIPQLNHRFVHYKIGSGLELLALQVLSAERFKELFPGRPPYNTDRHPYLEYAAPRAFYVGSHASVLDHDERVLRRRSSRLFLSATLGDRVLARDELAGLIRLFQAPLYPSEKRLLNGLLTSYTERFGVDSAEAVRDSTVRMVGVLLSRTGTLEAFRKLDKWLEKIRTNSMSLRDWRDYYAFETDQLRITTTVFTDPDTTRFAFAHAQCVGLLPGEAAKFESRKAALYTELGLMDPASASP